jgi:rare lipoprotein A
MLLSLVFAACTTQQTKETPPEDDRVEVAPETPSTRYADEQDFAPLEPIGPEQVSDARLRPDPILPFGNASPYTVNGVSYQVLEDYKGYRERGIASWYGGKFTGYKTSNGETYDLYKPSAAHKSLPIPSYARVTNLENGKSIVVRVNDRGPFHPDRLIDLSYAAAVKLGYMEQGTARVEVEVIEVAGVEDRRNPVYGDYRFIQVGAFGEESTARALRAELQGLLSAPVFISPADVDGRPLFRVRVGPAQDEKHFLALQQQLQDSGYQAGHPVP